MPVAKDNSIDLLTTTPSGRSMRHGNDLDKGSTETGKPRDALKHMQRSFRKQMCVGLMGENVLHTFEMRRGLTTDRAANSD